MGHIIVYDTESKSAVTRIYRELMGRIVSIKNKKYYYPGLFHDVKFFKIKNGCYYVDGNVNITSDMPVKFYSATVKIPKDKLMTGYNYWKQLADNKNINVRGL